MESHTIRLLQQMREEMRERFLNVDGQFQEMRERFDALDARVDGVTHIMTLLAGHTYHLEERVSKSETTAP